MGEWIKQCCEAGRALVAEFAMWTTLVVVTAEVLDDHARLGERPKLFLVEAFVPEAGVEALHEPILPGTAWVDIRSS